jgi:hypothetical protein
MDEDASLTVAAGGNGRFAAVAAREPLSAHDLFTLS